MGNVPEVGGVVVEKGMSYSEVSSACLTDIVAAGQTGVNHYVGVVVEAGMSYMDVVLAMLGL